MYDGWQFIVWSQRSFELVCVEFFSLYFLKMVDNVLAAMISSRVKCLALCIFFLLDIYVRRLESRQEKMLPKSNVAFHKFHLQQLLINTVRCLHCSHDAHENPQETRRSTKERIWWKRKKWNEWSINLFLCRYCVAFNLSLFLAFLFVCPLCASSGFK